jgi:CBS domain-containing protein
MVWCTYLLKLEDVMVEDVIAVEEGATAKEVAELMNKHEIGCLIVMKMGKPAGIVTERDLVKRILLESKDPEKTKISEIMSKPLIVGKPQMELEQTVRLMVEQEIKKLPVTQDGKLVGLITLTDILRFQPELLRIYNLLHNDIAKKIY